jgi:hypothetical protein
MAEGARGDRPDSGVKARGGIASAPGYRHLVDEWKRVFARYQPELDQELLRIAGRPCRSSTSALCQALFAAFSLAKVPADRIEPRKST